MASSAQNGFFATRGKAVLRQVNQDFDFCKKIPTSIDHSKHVLGELNNRRLQIVFSRLTVQEFLIYLKKQKLLNDLEKFLHQEVNVVRLNILNNTFNVLSVGIYALRFFLNIGVCIQKVVNNPENTDFKTGLKLFGKELYDIHPELLNDLVWGTINALTNFAYLFKIASPIANILVGAFLCFDIWLLGHRLWFKNKKYPQEKARKEKEIAECLQLNTQESLKRAKELQQELEEMPIDLEVYKNTIIYLITGAALLCCGFALAVLLTFPGAQPLAFFICTVGIAFYLSGDNFAKYNKAKLLLDENPEDLKLKENADKARTEVICSFIKNLFIPTLMLTVFTLYWPAGVVLLVAYLIYEYCDRASKNQEQVLTLPANAESENEEENESNEAEPSEQTPLLAQCREQSVSDNDEEEMDFGLERLFAS